MTAFYPLRVPVPCPECSARITEVTRDTAVETSWHCPDCGHDWITPANGCPRCGTPAQPEVCPDPDCPVT